MKSFGLLKTFNQVLLTALLAACTGTTTPTAQQPIEEEPDRLTVQISADNDSLLLGTNKQLSASIKNQRGQARNLPLSWTSTNPAVLSVTSTGLVTAVGEGSGQIVAGAMAVSDTLNLYVYGLAGSLRVEPEAMRLPVGDEFQVRAINGASSSSASSPVVWISSNESIASVTSSGVVIAKGTGAVTITAAWAGNTAHADVEVFAPDVASLTISPPVTSIDEGSTVDLNVTAYSANGKKIGSRYTVEWDSSDPTIAAIDQSGRVTGVSRGFATIRAFVQGRSASATVEVKTTSQAVASLQLSANSVSLDIGQSTQIVATLRDAQGVVVAGAPISWKSLDPSVASVSSIGRVTAVSGGSAVIVATSGGVSGSLAVNVNQPAAATVASVSVSLQPKVIAGGKTSKAVVTLKDASGKVLSGRAVAFSSSRVTVASVNAGGTITGVSAGEAAIVATSEGKSGQSFIEVTSGTSAITRVTVSAPSTTFNVGSNVQATASAFDAGGDSKSTTYTWQSSKPSVVTVSSSGMMTAVAAGNATITATANSNGTKGTLGVTVSSAPPPAVASVTIALSPSSVTVGQTANASAVARDGSSKVISGASFNYSSSNTSVATVSSSGVVSAKAAGTAMISASSAGKVGSSQLTVNAAPSAPPPPPPSTPPGSAAAALAKIGPTISPSAAAALGGGYAQYDVLWTKWEPTRWSAEGKDWSSNYYDRAQIYYAQWIRTGNATYKQRGDAVALDYRRNYLHASNYQTSPHWAQLDGIALHFWLNGDDSSRIALGKAAWNLAASGTWTRTGPYTDARQQARALTAMLLAWQANAPNAPSGGWAKGLDDALNAIIPQQSPDGAWRYPANTCDLSLNYMGAMLADALIRVYTEYRADSRIPGVVKKTADFLWTQWRSGDAVPSFNYYEAQCNNQHGNGGPYATEDLTGLFVTTYAWMAARDASYKSKSDAVFAATMKGIYPQGSKQFNQAFAYGWRAMGYLP